MQADYFLDRMQPYELRLICDGLHLRNKDSWEQARLCAYVTAQANSKKKLRPTDIVKFGWEKEQDTATTEKDIRQYTMADVEAIKQAALAREQELKRKGII